MVKIILLLITTIYIHANIFQSNCISCHIDKTELKLFMAKYTLQYSSKKNIKKALFRFLKAPSSNKSIMPYEYIQKIGFKKNSKLSNEDLKKAIDIYYINYKLNNFIK